MIDGYFKDWEKLENVMIITNGANSARLYAAYSTLPSNNKQLYFGLSVDKEYNLQPSIQYFLLFSYFSLGMAWAVGNIFLRLQYSHFSTPPH